MSVPTANWSYPTAIRFGAGRIKEIADACRAAGITRPLLVTDAGLAKLAITARAIGLLKDAGLPVTLFSEVQPNPVESNLEAGIAAFRSGAHDGVIAFGGGSGLDTGKVIAFMAGQTRPLWDFEDIGDWWTRADADKIAPVIAVPTTAGTGSEVGRAGVITQEATHTKKVIFHPKMMPRVVIWRKTSPPSPWKLKPTIGSPAWSKETNEFDFRNRPVSATFWPLTSPVACIHWPSLPHVPTAAAFAFAGSQNRSCAVRPMSDRACSGVSPGNCTEMFDVPCRVISASARPDASTRRRRTLIVPSSASATLPLKSDGTSAFSSRRVPP